MVQQGKAEERGAKGRRGLKEGEAEAEARVAHEHEDDQQKEHKKLPKRHNASHVGRLWRSGNSRSALFRPENNLSVDDGHDRFRGKDFLFRDRHDVF